MSSVGIAGLERLIQRARVEERNHEAEDIKERIESRQGARAPSPVPSATTDALVAGTAQTPGSGITSQLVASPPATTDPVEASEASPLPSLSGFVTTLLPHDRGPSGVFSGLDAAKEPPRVGDDLLRWLAHDADGSNTVSASELAAFLESQGLDAEASLETANVLFRSMGHEELGTEDKDALQDALTKAWIAASPERAQRVLSDVARGGRLDRDELVAGLASRGWDATTIASMERVVFSEGGRFDRRTFEGNRWLDRFSAFRSQQLARALSAVELDPPTGASMQAVMTHPSGVQVIAPILSAGGPPAALALGLRDSAVPPMIGEALLERLESREPGTSSLDADEITTLLEAEGYAPEAARGLAQTISKMVHRDEITAWNVRLVQRELIEAWIAVNPERAESLLHDAGRGMLYSRDEVKTGLLARGWPESMAEGFADVVTGSTFGGSCQKLSRRDAGRQIERIAERANEALIQSMDIAAQFAQAELRLHAASALSEKLESALGVADIIPMFATAEQWVPDLATADHPPEVQASLIDALVRGDANGDQKLDAQELTEYFRAGGKTDEAASAIATQLLAAAEGEALTLEDALAVQDAMTRAWLAADPERAAGLLDDMSPFGHFPHQLRDHLEARGFSEALVESLKRLAPDLRRRSDWEGLVSRLAEDASARAIAEASAIAGVVTGMLDQLPRGLSWTPQRVEEPEAMAPADAARLVARNQHVLRDLVRQTLREDVRMDLDHLASRLSARGMRTEEADALARTVMTLHELRTEDASEHSVMSVRDLMRTLGMRNLPR